MSERQLLKKKLSVEFEMKDFGEFKYFLGIEVVHSSKGISISQRKYVFDLRQKREKLDANLQVFSSNKIIK